ncbi:MAG: hypothetical protein IK093_15440 [Ruminiclostridium sp.]|nr:hypothetical protein [Ruminiclostridium sp.]
MKTDIEEHGDKHIYGEQPYGDPDIDEPEWMRLLNAIKEELKKRGK